MKKLIKFLTSILLLNILSSCGSSATEINKSSLEDVSNENGSAYYEVFVGEFADSNNDGIGDLNGLKAKLPYLSKLGVSSLWLMPIMPSSSYHKYDVDSYYDIDESYGTMEDFESLIQEANTYHINIIIDMVLNHTSASNPYFIQSCIDYRDGNEVEDSYKDWYVWTPKGGTGYSKNNTANAYYEANFDANMPELNFDNPAVRKEIENILSFWLAKGVKGFRFDAATYYYYQNVTKNVEVLSWIKNYCQSIKEDVYLVGEVYTSSRSTLMDYAKSGVNVFNFAMSETTSNGWAYAANGGKGKSLATYVCKYQSLLKDASSEVSDAPFISNHDMDRSAGYLQGDNAKLAASAYLLAPGHPFIYYGEEIGLRGKRPNLSSTDADRRLAMIWSEVNDTARCLDPVGATYNDKSTQVTKGALDNIDDTTSLTYHYRKVLSIRNKYNDFFEKGEFTSISENDALYALKITYNGESIYVVTNFSEENQSISLNDVEVVDEIKITSNKDFVANNKYTLGSYNTIILK